MGREAAAGAGTVLARVTWPQAEGADTPEGRNSRSADASKVKFSFLLCDCDRIKLRSTSSL